MRRLAKPMAVKAIRVAIEVIRMIRKMVYSSHFISKKDSSYMLLRIFHSKRVFSMQIIMKRFTKTVSTLFQPTILPFEAL